MKQLTAVIAQMSQPEIAQLEKEGSIAVTVEEQVSQLELADVEVISEDIPGWLVANEGTLSVALDITLTEALKQEGLARELVNRIQNLRKSSNFDITDRIKLTLTHAPEMDLALETFRDYIANQVLAADI
jgi:isoleucyl-tRNA synthetase